MDIQRTGQDKRSGQRLRVRLVALLAVLALIALVPSAPASASQYVLPTGICWINLNGSLRQMNGSTDSELWTNWDCGARAAYEAWQIFGDSYGTVEARFKSMKNYSGTWSILGSSLGEYYESGAGAWSFGGLVCGMHEGRPFRCNANLGVEFFSKGSCTGNSLGFFDADRQNFIYDDRIENDEARSMYVHAVRPGTRIEIYDNPYGHRNDDWSETRALHAVVGNCIEDLNYNTFNDGLFEHTMHWKNGLAGKVSHIRIYVP